MTKLDEVSEAIGELKSDIRAVNRNVKYIGTRLDKIDEHLENHCNRIDVLESEEDKRRGMIKMFGVISGVIAFIVGVATSIASKMGLI